MLDANWRTVQVYMRCQLTWAGMGTCIGLSASEAMAVMHAARVPPRERMEMLDGLQLMGRIQAGLINDRAGAGAADKGKDKGRSRQGA